LALLIFGESLTIAGFGAAIGIALTFPVADGFGKAMGRFLPVFNVHAETLYMQVAAGLIVGTIAALVPCVRAARIRIVDGLRSVG
jgi:putative ABC transport system permease protein